MLCTSLFTAHSLLRERRREHERVIFLIYRTGGWNLGLKQSCALPVNFSHLCALQPARWTMEKRPLMAEKVINGEKIGETCVFKGIQKVPLDRRGEDKWIFCSLWERVRMNSSVWVWKRFAFADRSVLPQCPGLLRRGIRKEPGGYRLVSILLSLPSPPHTTPLEQVH